MKNDTKPEELKWMLNGGRSLRPGGEFHRAEILMYEQYLQIHKILGCPPVGSTIINSESLIDTKIRQTMDKAIKDLIVLAHWRDRKTKEKEDTPSPQNILESLSYCTRNYDGSNWTRYCIDCNTTSCEHAKNKNKWRKKKDSNGKQCRCFHYQKIPSDVFHLIK